MRPSDLPEFKVLLTQVLAFYRQDVTEFTLDVWKLACMPFDIEQVRKAFTAHATNPDGGHFPPKPADIVRQLHGTQTDRALLAWGEVYQAMRDVGAYTSVDFGNPAIHAAVVDVGGWPALCRTGTDELAFVQKRFCDAFRTYSARGAPDAPPRLSGVSAIDNLALPAPPPERVVRIGAARQQPLLEGTQP